MSVYFITFHRISKKKRASCFQKHLFRIYLLLKCVVVQLAALLPLVPALRFLNILRVVLDRVIACEINLIASNVRSLLKVEAR